MHGPVILRLATAAILAASAGASAAPAQAAAVPAARLPDSLIIPGPHSVVIRRVTSDLAARRALEAAERADPPREELFTSRAATPYRLRERPADPRVWWNSVFDGVRIPYAITDAAVAYYLELSAALRRGETGSTAGIRMSSSRLEYVATVERQASFALGDTTYADVYVVRLRLEWLNYCGPLCALSFTHDRTVVVDDAGVVRAIRGDGNSQVTVS
jgi:hypothetical protein